jgi:hypothetical protein
VKKTIAAISASVLGIGGAVGAAASPASAVVPACSNSLQHEVNPTVSPTDSWYMECIPQYGMGKAEFTTTTDAANPFPDGYELDNGHQSVTSTPTASQVSAYFSAEATDAGLDPTYTGAFVDLSEDPTVSTATSQVYDSADVFDGLAMTVAYPIVAVGQATDGLPAACTPDGSGATYEGEYKVTFGPTTTHFSQTIDDVVHSVTVTYTPDPLYLGLNFDDAEELYFDESKPICTSSGGETNFSPFLDEGDPESADSINWIVAAYSATTLPPTLETLSPAAGGIGDLSDPEDFFSGTTTDFGSFATTSTPVLATTGLDTRPAGTLGAGLLSLGILATLVGVVRRRRRSLPDPR